MLSTTAKLPDARRREIFVNVPAARPATEQSFEEWRLADYIKAYMATGRPPQPSPLQPTDKAQRARAGLPPLFEPYIEVGGIPAPPSESAAAAISLTSLEVVTAEPLPRNPEELPEVQIFQATLDANEFGNKVYLQNVVCQHMYSAFSPEELRLKAYLSGKIFAVEETHDTTDDPNEHMQSITATAQYSKHSFEELRLAYLRTHRELTSEQISQMRITG